MSHHDYIAQVRLTHFVADSNMMFTRPNIGSKTICRFAAFLLLLLSCSTVTEVVSPPLYTFNYAKYLRTDGVAFWAMAAGDITNIGTRDIMLRPILELYFTEEDYNQRIPSIKAVGAIGILDKTIDNGLVEKREKIRPDEMLQHFTKTEKFVPPSSSGSLFHRITFEPL